MRYSLGVSGLTPGGTAPETEQDTYPRLVTLARSLLEDERDFIANIANLSALLFHSLPRVNWCGFYLSRGEDLVLGPFQGKIACVRIAPGQGVCGASAGQKRTLIVQDVHEFPGHIACDPESRSEIVVPVLRNDRLLAVLDIDSPFPNRFDERDAAGLEQLVRLLLVSSDDP